MAETEDVVTVREAARLTTTTTSQVHSWIKRGLLPAQPGRHGFLVSVSAVRRLVEARAPAPSGEYVPPSVAARRAGVTRQRVSLLAKTGTVASRPGPYGRLVRLVDVLAVAAQSPTRRDAADEDTP